MFFLQFIAISCFSPDKLVDKFIVHTIIAFEATLLDIKYQARARSAGGKYSPEVSYRPSDRGARLM